MINAVNEQFSRFVNFAQERFDAGKTKAIATKGDIAVGGGTPLEERNINVAPKGDWVGNVWFRKDDAKAANNEVRELFKKTIIDMFGGEKNIPDSVKDAMLMKDYGCGKPLTARRILAVKKAIDNLGRVDGFDKTNDPKGELATKANEAGYSRKDFGRLNTAANLLAQREHISIKEALAQVITQGSAANRMMKAGPLYMKDIDSFNEGYDFHRQGAADDARNLEVAKQYAGASSTDRLAVIATNLKDKFAGFLHDAELLLEAADPLGTNGGALDKVRGELNNLSKEFEGLAKDLESCTLTNRSEIYKKLFCNDGVTRVEKLVNSFCKDITNEAAQNPAMRDLRQHLTDLVADLRAGYDKLAKTYKTAVGVDMYPAARDMLENAVISGRLNTRTAFSIPQGITDNLENALKDKPFEVMNNLKALCGRIKKKGDEGLRFNDTQKADLKQLFTKVMGGGPKAESALARLIDKFETVFFAEYLINQDAAANEFSRPDLIVNYFKENPEVLSTFDPGFKLDDDDAIGKLKNAIKDRMLEDLKKPLKQTDDGALTSLSSGIMPQTIREYNMGRVKFNGQNIPCANLGKTFPFNHANNPARKGFAEFLETKFDANHKKMRQMVSFSCGMALGLGGAIDSLLDNGGNVQLKGIPRQDACAKGSLVIAADRPPEDHYNIEIADNGDVKITLSHIVQNKMTQLFTSKGVNYSLGDISADASPLVGKVKFTATMTIKNASDAELGDKMPEFTIDDFRQEEI